MPSKTLLLTGATGFLGLRLAPELASQWTVVRASRTATGPGSVKLDQEDPESVLRAYESVRPDAVVHSGAMARPDECEVEPDRAQRVNVDSARVLAQACGRTGARMVHLSTDLVFDGKKGYYDEDSPVGPTTVYGRTKVASEEAVLTAAPGAVVLRVSSLYGRPIGAPRCFIDALRDTLSRGEPTGAFEDEWRSPTTADRLHEVILKVLAEPDLEGVYHWAGPDRVTRFEMAVALCRAFGWDEGLLRRTRAADQKRPAPRPRDTTLDSSRLAGMLGLAPMSMAEGFAALKAVA